MRRTIQLVILAITFIATPAQLWASAPASGTIIAKQTCDAFVSKNKRTNPGHVKLNIDQTYPVFEVNKAQNPSWYRVRIENASPKERWVAKHCGEIDVEVTGSGGSGGGSGNACHTPGLEDSYVLALSWQPAFCETRPEKPECRIDDPESYQARNFTLHGLWPNKKECGKKYNYCGDIRNKPGDFCDYPALQLFTEVRADLEEVMPSAAEGSCLQRHEWHKHGTCQTDWSIDGYYETSVDLTRQFNESGLAYFISRNIGKTVTEEAFKNKVDCAHGTGAHKSIELKCKSGNLIDVYIHLPHTINEGDSLAQLMEQGQGTFKSNCGGRFKVDPIGFDQ